MNKESQKILTPEEKFVEASYELAVYRLLQEEEQQLELKITGNLEQNIKQHAEKILPHALTRIDHQMQKLSHRHVLQKTGLRLLRSAAMIILIVNFLLSIAVATNATVRVKAFQFLTTINSSYMKLEFEERSEKLDIPADWEEDYFPAYIPEGYELTFYLPEKGFALLDYKQKNGDSISIEIFGIDTIYKTNIENASIEYITIQNSLAAVIEQPYTEINFVWSAGNHIFVVEGKNKNEVISVAKSMSPIQAQK